MNLVLRGRSFLHRHMLVLIFSVLSLTQGTVMVKMWDISHDVRQHAQVIEDNARETCENRASGRHIVRNVMFGFVEQFDPSDPQVAELKLYIQDNYPEIDCEKELNK